MKIHNLFNSRSELLASFTDEAELCRYIRRHSRDAQDTKIFTTKANDWNEESGGPIDTTEKYVWSAYEKSY